MTAGPAASARAAGERGLDRPAALLAGAGRWLRGDVEIDEWGCAFEAQDAVDFVLRQAVRVTVVGGEHVPARGPALVVANRRFGIVEPIALGRAIRQVAGRRMRYVGLPDVAPVGTVLRRLGMAVARPAEVASLLRAGHLVGLPLAVEVRSRMRAGNLSPGDMAPALEVGAPVVPVAVVAGGPLGPWRVDVGEPVGRPRARGPLALAELADAAPRAVQALLDEAFPPRWPFS